jgi:ABC-type branched-subunit amino acid transport system ATPase component
LNGIGRIFEDLRLINNLSVLENNHLAIKNNQSDSWYKVLFNHNEDILDELSLERSQ